MKKTLFWSVEVVQMELTCADVSIWLLIECATRVGTLQTCIFSVNQNFFKWKDFYPSILQLLLSCLLIFYPCMGIKESKLFEFCLFQKSLFLPLPRPSKIKKITNLASEVVVGKMKGCLLAVAQQCFFLQK